uniref:Uncharacterized protein n=1 Tax=Meloidogyne enterolobii TaxID=390850 RepID=A0A6V7VLF3_MELEN|nr:unnamed protein product [Meloidogyne enterolobii]
MRTPKQLEEWSFSTINSDNIEDDSNKIGDETLVEEENFTEKSSNVLETFGSIEDGLSTKCSSCRLAKNIIEGLIQRMEKFELKLRNNDLSLENCGFKLKDEIQKINTKHEKEIKNLKQNYQKLIEEIIKKMRKLIIWKKK